MLRQDCLVLGTRRIGAILKWVSVVLSSGRIPQGSHHLILYGIYLLIRRLFFLALLIDLVLEQLNAVLHAGCLRCHVLQLTLHSGGFGFSDA